MVCLRRAIEILAKTGTKKLKIFPKTGSCQQPKDKQRTEKKKNNFSRCANNGSIVV